MSPTNQYVIFSDMILLDKSLSNDGKILQSLFTATLKVVKAKKDLFKL